MRWTIFLLMLFAACQPTSEVTTSTEIESSAYAQSISPEDARVYLITPEDGAVLPAGEVNVKFGLSGMGVAPATVKFQNSGHHHLLVNVSGLPAMDQPIPTDSAHIHFGLGQTETTLELGPGTHTLQLILGDYSHIPHNPPVISEPVTITVE